MWLYSCYGSLFCPKAVDFGFTQPRFEAREDQGFVTVMVALTNGNLDIEVALSLTTNSSTATGM